MSPSPDWHSILAQARRGEVEAAEAAHRGAEENPSPAPSRAGMDAYFYGRCLAEANWNLPEAFEALGEAMRAEPDNPLYAQALALARLESDTPDGARKADEIWHLHGLPHERDLLGAVSIALELQARRLPQDLPEKLAPWPAMLRRPIAVAPLASENSEPLPEGAVLPDDAAPPQSVLAIPAQDDATLPSPGIAKPKANAPRKIKRRIAEIERLLLRHRSARALQEVCAVMATGFEDAALHLLGGIAADDLDDADRARAHLARALELDPALHMARLYLGRAWWRMGWTQQAIALWRTLPVEGPVDHGRHYFLALGHAALGNRAAALDAMGIALTEFFYDTRHFFIERALYRWRLHWRLPVV